MRLRMVVLSGLLAAIALGAAPANSGAAASRLRLETTELGNLTSEDILIAQGRSSVDAGGISLECFGSELLGALTVNDAAKDKAVLEKQDKYGCLTVPLKIELTGKGVASIAAASKKMAFLGEDAAFETCIYEAGKLKGLWSPEPFEIEVAGTGKLNRKTSQGGCPVTAQVTVGLVLYAAEAPFRLYEEAIKGRLE